MARTVNAETLAYAKRLEGCKLTAYPDPGSRDGTPWTVGYGRTKGVKKGMTISQAQADIWLTEDLDYAASVVDRAVKVPLTDNQFGALVLFTHNIGAGDPNDPKAPVGFRTSTLLKKLNAGDYASVPAQLARWNKNDGHVMEGLVNRRAAEAGLWAKGSFAASNTVDAKPEVPKWATPETMAAGGGLLTGAAGIASGNGPVQWALGIVFVIAAIVIAYTFVSKRVKPS